jgi:hypothetical protein
MMNHWMKARMKNNMTNAKLLRTLKFLDRCYTNLQEEARVLVLKQEELHYMFRDLHDRYPKQYKALVSKVRE